MNQYFILKEYSNKYQLKTGTIIYVENNIAKIKPENIAIENIDELKETLMKVENNEAAFLLKFSIDKRMKKYNNKTFFKLNQLKIGDKCFFKGSYIDKGVCKIQKKSIQQDGIKFDLKLQNCPFHDYEGIDMAKIRLIQNAFFLVKESEKCNQIGLIYEIVDEKKIDYETKSIITFSDLNFQAVKLSEEELSFYANIPKDQRVQSYDKQILNKINDLKINDHCKIQIECKIIDKIIDKNHVLIKYETNDGRVSDIRASLVDDAWKIENTEKKLSFIDDKIVNANKISCVRSLNDSYGDGIKIGDPVIINIRKKFIGELKWIGLINNEKCVGVDMEDEFEYGMDGVLIDGVKFDCLPKHGLITLLSNVELYKCDQKLETLENGIINPRKYIKCEENWDINILRTKEISKDIFVYIRMIRGGKKSKMKGNLKWCGLMNGISVGGVELITDHENGTDGRFWRRKLFHCHNKRALAVLLDNIDKYTPYESKVIPIEECIFRDLDINTAVKYYLSDGKEVIDLYGTIRWTGVNENDEYLFGIELEDRRNDATSGTFNGQKLFQCRNNHGILVPISRVCRDIRFVDIADLVPYQTEKSNECQVLQYGVLVKLSEGLNKGIQGNENSSCLVSLIIALFVNCDVLDFMISPFLNETESVEITRKLRHILSSKIIYPLREFGFVSFHRIEEMSDIIKQFGISFGEIMKPETNLENMFLLLSKLCLTEQLLRVESRTQGVSASMSLDFPLTLKSKSKFITSEEMIILSMTQNGMMFAEHPTCLIYLIPQNTKGIASYDYVLPSNIIDISHVCSNTRKKCYDCDAAAIYQCIGCMEESKLNIRSGFRCEKHSCFHKEKIKLNILNFKSNSRVFMELKAIICIEKSNFVSYVKQAKRRNDKYKINDFALIKNDFENQWFCFASINSQFGKSNYGNPKVTQSEVLSLSKEEMELEIKSYIDFELSRIITKSCVFIYHNSTKTCY